MTPTAIALAALLAFPAGAQDPAGDDAEARKALLRDLDKQLRSFDEGVRLDTVEALAGIDDSKARSMLARKLTSDTEKVRIAAAKALAAHRHGYCADALGHGLRANFKHGKIVKAYIEALGELDMCDGINPLLRALETNPKQGVAALDALVKIGCPEAVPPLINYLKKAEIEEKKPDEFKPLQTGGAFARGRLRNRGPIPNKTKDKDVAKLAPKVRATLEKLTSQKYADYKAWYDANRFGKLRRNVVAVYRCPEADKTFELPAGRRVKCPHAADTPRHKDVLLKHRPE